MISHWTSVYPPVCPSTPPSINISFPDDNLNKNWLIFTKLGMCIDIVKIWFRTANGQILSILPTTHLYFCFWMITWVNINGFSPNLICGLILWESYLGLLMGKFCQFFTELSACHTSVFSFPDDNFSKYQLIFTKLGMCIDIVVWDC